MERHVNLQSGGTVVLNFHIFQVKNNISSDSDTRCAVCIYILMNEQMDNEQIQQIGGKKLNLKNEKLRYEAAAHRLQ